MSADGNQAIMHEVNLTSAPSLSLLFDEAVREGRPVMLVRDEHERGLLLSREQQLRILEGYRFHVNVIPEDEGGFTLWLRELKIGEYGETLLKARKNLLDSVRDYVQYYYQDWDFLRHIAEMAAQEPYVYRLSLAANDNELITMLFGSPSDAEARQSAALAS